jgi:aminoglycoside phosphotransferase (APT) family kinase protein
VSVSLHVSRHDVYISPEERIRLHACKMPPKRAAATAPENPRRGKRVRRAPGEPPPAPLKPRPSDTWVVNPVFDVQQVDDVIANADWGWLEQRAETLHPENATCNIDSAAYTRGVHNAVFELAFTDGTYWIVRINLDAITHPVDRKGMLSEYATMKVVRERTTLRVPRVYDYNLDPGNPFGFVYTIMEALPGRALDGRLCEIRPAFFKRKVAKQFADAVYQLSRIRFNMCGRIWCGDDLNEEPTLMETYTGRGPFKTSAAYFRAIRESERGLLQGAYGQTNDWPRWDAAIKLQLWMIPKLMHPEWRHGPFMLSCADMKFYNLLVDDDYNITGFLDWSGAEVVPIEAFVNVFEFRRQVFDRTKTIMWKIASFQKSFLNCLIELGIDEPGKPSIVGAFRSRLQHVDIAHNSINIDLVEYYNRRCLSLLFGNETTMQNYKERCRLGCGQPWPNWLPGFE